jgi:shikimate dehydrogenase
MKPKPLHDSTFTIVGTGLMGTSLAMALRGTAKRLHGVDRNPQHLAGAARHFDRVSVELTDEALLSDVIVLATPVRTILVMLDQLAKRARPGTLITDIGSTKRDIVAEMSALPDHLLAIGGHPMCGRETSGPQDATGDLFADRPYIFCPTLRTTPAALRFAQDLAACLRATCYILDADKHDAAVAAISHLPYLVSSGLVGMVQQIANQDSVADLPWQLASTGFKDTSRLAGSDVAMMADIVETNREAVFHALDVFHEQIDSLKGMLLHARDLQLRDKLERIRQGRREWERSYFKQRQGQGGQPAPGLSGSTEITGETQLVGVMGWPVKHSLSPAMHNAAFDKLGLNWRYVPLAVRPEALPAAVRGLASLGFRGVNLTVPHKVDVLPMLDHVSDEARLVGAANTLRIDPVSGALSGTNTDMDGFMADLRAHGVQVTPQTHALVLGAGGAARAISVGLGRAGARVTIVNRTADRAEVLRRLLIEHLPVSQVQVATFDQWRGDHAGLTREVALIVNTTPLGMWPDVDASPWPAQVPFPQGATLYDTIYRPQQTRLMQQASAAGLRAIGGIGMLVQQGAAAFAFWTGQAAPADVMLEACLSRLAERAERS